MLSLWFTNSKVHLGGDGTGYIALHLGLGVSWFLEFNCDLCFLNLSQHRLTQFLEQCQIFLASRSRIVPCECGTHDVRFRIQNAKVFYYVLYSFNAYVRSTTPCQIISHVDIDNEY